MKNRAMAWVVFLLCILLLSLAATPYSTAADHVLIALRLAIIVVISVLVVHERWKHRHNLEGQESQTRPDMVESFLRRCRRWYYGE